MLGTHSGANAPTVVRGGTWTQGYGDPTSLIPNGSSDVDFVQALYLPLFYGDARGVIHAGAATEVPTPGTTVTSEVNIASEA